MLRFNGRTPIEASTRELHTPPRSRPARHATAALLLGLAPTAGFACACGCGVFDVGTASMFPQHSGVMAFVEYDFMDQDKNWSGSSQASADNNSDKRIRTSFMNVGLQYQFNQSWGVSVEIPYWHRYFQTEDNSGNIVGFTHGALGDIRLKGVYTGFSPEMSTGLVFGLKLPTGDSTYANFDPDTEIGSGSTDTLLGIYHLGNLTRNSQWRYFLQAQWDEPVRHKADYRPGNEVIATAGTYYEGWSISPTARIALVLQLNATYRGHDGGPAGHPQDSGYTRLLVTPGVEVDLRKVAIYLDVGLPVHTNSSGNQLVSSRFWRANMSYRL
jgi:hypothetical protein